MYNNKSVYWNFKLFIWYTKKDVMYFLKPCWNLFTSAWFLCVFKNVHPNISLSINITWTCDIVLQQIMRKYKFGHNTSILILNSFNWSLHSPSESLWQFSKTVQWIQVWGLSKASQGIIVKFNSPNKLNHRSTLVTEITFILTHCFDFAKITITA